MLEFRPLEKEEINVRIQSTNKNGYTTLLLYKNARCDMDRLDEAVGCMNWKREHTRNNSNCIVSIWDKEKSQWVSKEDTGTESNTEQEKGLASDSFKRACFNWGIGRELYTAPRISVKGVDKYDVLEVSSIKISNKKITALEIKNVTKNKIIFTYNKEKEIEKEETLKKESKELEKKRAEFNTYLASIGRNTEWVEKTFGIQSINNLNLAQFKVMVKNVKSWVETVKKKAEEKK